MPLTLALPGALFTHLAPTAIALPCYFCLADAVLVAQCAYYNHRNRGKQTTHPANGDPSEQSPLLRRESTGANGATDADVVAKIVPDEDETDESSGNGKQWLQNSLCLVAVYIVGIAAWFLSYKAGAWDTSDPVPDAPEEAVNNPLEMAGLALGYISAVLYLWWVYPRAKRP